MQSAPFSLAKNSHSHILTKNNYTGHDSSISKHTGDSTAGANCAQLLSKPGPRLMTVFKELQFYEKAYFFLQWKITEK
tara:strand:- start:128 stop:361 length:234 start_codon:yes stop_codon:yes gene_type:complete